MLKIPIEEKHNKKNIKVLFKPKHLTVTWGAEGKIDGELIYPVKAEHCTWYIETNKTERLLMIELARVEEDKHWNRIFTSDPEPVRASGGGGMGGMEGMEGMESMMGGGGGGGMGGMGKLLYLFDEFAKCFHFSDMAALMEQMKASGAGGGGGGGGEGPDDLPGLEEMADDQ